MRAKWIITTAVWAALVILFTVSHYGWEREVDLIVVLAAQAVLAAISGWILYRWIRHPDVSANGLYPKWLEDYLLDNRTQSRASR